MYVSLAFFILLHIIKYKFCYHSVITSGCQDNLPATVFLYHSLFFSDLFNFSRQQKNPRNTRFLGYLTFGHKLSCDNKSIFRLYYSMIVATRPDPTVRPPSRIANVRPWLIAIGWMSSIVISTLSPGMHISVPAGRLHTPVTSVVLK